MGAIELSKIHVTHILTQGILSNAYVNIQIVIIFYSSIALCHINHLDNYSLKSSFYTYKSHSAAHTHTLFTQRQFVVAFFSFSLCSQFSFRRNDKTRLAFMSVVVEIYVEIVARYRNFASFRSRSALWLCVKSHIAI